MRIVYFAHSLVSCWNNGNAHFQRGVLRALRAVGHDVAAYEQVDGWSLQNLVADQGADVVDGFTHVFADLPCRTYTGLDALGQAVEGADLVVVHEWNDPSVVSQIGRLHRQQRFILLFHDTHHRAVSEPDAIRRFDLSGYDGVLAFGETLAQVYRSWGWAGRVFVWHEAADTDLFKPPAVEASRDGAVWIGNWGEGERTAEIEAFLLAPAQRAGVTLDVHGVRYPPDALQMLQRYGARYHGWVANAAVPEIFARHRMTVHVPRRYYSQMLPGIPTIRVFEALACGIPLITAPWQDSEGLFRPGTDYLVAETGDEMQAHMLALDHDAGLAKELSAAGLSRILSRHSCSNRAAELLGIVASLQGRPGERGPPPDSAGQNDDPEPSSHPGRSNEALVAGWDAA